MTTTTTSPTPTEVLEAKVDPMPAATLGMWLFLASEAMFFAAILAGFIVLQSVPGARAVFARSAGVPNLGLAIGSAMLLVASIVAVWRRARGWTVAGLATAFLIVQVLSCWLLLTHRTIVTTDAIYDGRWTYGGHFHGTKSATPSTLDLARLMPGELTGPVGNHDVSLGDAVQADVNYGPSRNNYFACFFLITGAHAIHVVGGLIALAWLAVRRRSATEPQRQAVGMYWQFVNVVGLLAIAMLTL